MKKSFLLFLAVLCLGLMGVGPPFPGDGYDNPDAEGVSGHGPALKYTDNGDGTFTDKVTKFMWEKKLKADGSEGGDCDGIPEVRSVHCANIRYDWTDGVGNNEDADGELFTVFLDPLNGTCEGEDVTDCESHKDCAKGEKCGFAGHTDWCIPNVKMLQSIVDYSVLNPSTSFPGATRTSIYWSSTTFADSPSDAWSINFITGFMVDSVKLTDFFARAVRPCS